MSADAGTSDHQEPGARSTYPADWGTFARRAASVGLAIGFVVVAVLAIPILEVATLAAILTFLLSYPTRWLTRYTRLSETVAAAFVSAAYLIIATVAVLFVVVPTAHFLAGLASDAAAVIQRFLDFLASLAPAGTTPPTWNYNAVVLTAIGGAAMTIGGLIGLLLVASVLGIAFLFEVPPSFRSALRASPPAHRREVAILTASIHGIWSDYFRATLVCGALMGALTAAQLLLMGIRGALLIGAFTAAVSVVPIVGGFVALVPIGLAPLVYGSTVLQTDRLTLVLLVIGINLFIQLIMWNLIQPLILGHALTLPASVVMLVVGIGTVIGGMLGAFVAVPVAAVVREVVVYLLRKIRGGDPYPGTPEPPFVAKRLPDAADFTDEQHSQRTE